MKKIRQKIFSILLILLVTLGQVYLVTGEALAASSTSGLAREIQSLEQKLKVAEAEAKSAEAEAKVAEDRIKSAEEEYGIAKIPGFNTCDKLSENKCKELANNATQKRKKSEKTKAKLEKIKAELDYARGRVAAMSETVSLFDTKDSTGILQVAGQGKFSNAKALLDNVIDLLIKLIGTVALIFIVIGGFRLIVAAGNDTEIQRAKEMLKYAVVGLIVALLAYVIVAMVQGLIFR